MRSLPACRPDHFSSFRGSAGFHRIARRRASSCGPPPLPRFGGTIDIMRVTIQLPDDISAALEEQWDDVPRRSLEAIAVEAYRTGALTDSQVRRLLGFESRFQVHALLKEHHVPLQYTAADLEDDLHAQRELGILPSR